MSAKKALPVSQLLAKLYEDTPAYIAQADLLQAKISTTIETARIERKMNQHQFAEFMGVTQSQVSKWENEDCNFTISKLCEIAHKLNLKCTVSLDAKPTLSATGGKIIYAFPPQKNGWSAVRSYASSIEVDDIKEM